MRFMNTKLWEKQNVVHVLLWFMSLDYMVIIFALVTIQKFYKTQYREGRDKIENLCSSKKQMCNL